MDPKSAEHLDDTKDAANEPIHSDDGELTPPHGDELRSEESFGRTDRYSNIDDQDATRERERNDRGNRTPATNMGETTGGARPS